MSIGSGEVKRNAFAGMALLPGFRAPITGNFALEVERGEGGDPAELERCRLTSSRTDLDRGRHSGDKLRAVWNGVISP